VFLFLTPGLVPRHAGAACSYGLSSDGSAFTAQGGSGSVTVLTAAGCSWTVTPGGAPWISAVSPLSGAGRGTVTFAVSPNSEGAPRSSTLRIEGQGFTVGQGLGFSDVLSSHPFFAEIGKLSAWSVTLGCGSGAYCPDSPVTREQMAVFIVRALGSFSPPAPETQRFSDVAPSRYGYAFIHELAQRAITVGCDTNLYCPDAVVTREQMAIFIERAIGVLSPSQPSSQRFVDVAPSRFGYAFIDDLARRGITQGCASDRFCPDDPVTRGQMAAFLTRAFGMTSPPSPPPTADVVRYLEQASFGPTPELVSLVESIGIPAHIEEQFAEPVSGYPVLSPWPSSPPADCTGNCIRDNYTQYPLQLRFFQNALGARDQLRQRVTFALSQIFVVSGLEIRQPSSLSPFLQILTNGAFGNFRQLLYDVTMNPAMGRYLDMVDNDKPNPSTGIEPNENYARELLQLFSLGLYELNPDGTQRLGKLGTPVPTYDQDSIEGFAHVFTGWTYATQAGQTPRRHNPEYYVVPMELYASNHDTGPKTLLGGLTLPGGQDAYVELNAALDNIFNHSNVGPFISRQLIQHLVTSNPRPEYVARVTAAFNDNGLGVRGDMKAVVRAILLDPEARGPVKTAAEYGHLREPALYVTGLCRSLQATSDGILNTVTSALGQNIFYSPSVFNYFPPDYAVPGTAVLGPEFAIESSSVALNRANLVNLLAFSKIQPPAPATGTTLDFSALQDQTDYPEALVRSLNKLLLHGTMSVAMKNAIASAVSAVPSTDTLKRARTAFYLVGSSSQYKVQR
jgi:hypothetical protein